MQVQYQLVTLKKGFDFVADYYQKVKLLYDTLAIASKSLHSIEFITYLLAGLGTDFESVVTCITTRVDPLSPSQVYSHLLNHETCIFHQTLTLTSSRVFFANFSFKHVSGQPSRGQGDTRDRGGYHGKGRGRSSGRTSSPPAKFVLNMVI